MSGLYLLDIQALPGPFVQEVMQRSQLAVRNGVAAGNGKIICGFKINGESRFITVIENGLSAVEEQVYSLAGDGMQMTCSSLRHFEKFAQSVLQTEARLGVPGTGRLASEGRQIYWLLLEINYPGRSCEELLVIWKEDAEYILGGRAAGKFDVAMFKAIAEKKVHMFISVPDGDTLDDIMMNLPIMKQLGNHVTVMCKAVTPY